MDLRAKIIVFAQLPLLCSSGALALPTVCVRKTMPDPNEGSRAEATKWHFPCFSLNSTLLGCLWTQSYRRKKGAFWFLRGFLKNTFWLPVDLWEVALRSFQKTSSDFNHKRATLYSQSGWKNSFSNQKNNSLKTVLQHLILTKWHSDHLWKWNVGFDRKP